MPAKPTGAEVIASVMEPAPALPSAYSHQLSSPLGWWMLGETMHGGMRWYPNVHTLDLLRLVEERLTDKQWRYYCILMFQACCKDAQNANPIQDELRINRQPLIHASAERKIAALAGVLRED